MVERRLGRGLDFFLTEASEATQAPATGSSDPSSTAAGEKITQLDINQCIPNPDQPRRDFHEAEIQELAESIRTSGLLQPILARQAGDKFQIIAGERRWRAAKQIGIERIPVIVRPITDEQAAVFGLVENLHRADLNPIEKARAFRRIQEITSCATEEVSRKVGLDRTTVTNFMRLLELPKEVLAHVSRGTLSMGHARALLGLPGSDSQRTAAENALRANMSVRQVEVMVQKLKQGLIPPKTDASGKPKQRIPSKDAWIKECEDTLADTLQAKVSVRYGRRKSKITIDCLGREDFERIYAMLQRARQSDS